MNQGRIWCVVHPTIGLPLLLGSVALTSLAVHTAVMTHSDWMGNYWEGAKAKTALNTTTASPAAFSMKVTPVPAAGATPASFLITVSPNGATATPVRTASAQ
jgi:light-harvesting protein B-800-850 alpha chain